MEIIEKLGITTGPWEYQEWSGSIGIIKDKRNFCIVDDCGMESLNLKQSERKANARSISASPEMLEALIETNIILQKLFPTVNIDSERDMLQYFLFHKNSGIIEKATGKTWQEIKELL